MSRSERKIGVCAAGQDHEAMRPARRQLRRSKASRRFAMGKANPHAVRAGWQPVRMAAMSDCASRAISLFQRTVRRRQASAYAATTSGAGRVGER